MYAVFLFENQISDNTTRSENNPCQIKPSWLDTISSFGMWLSLVERCVRDAETGGSNPLIPTIEIKGLDVTIWPLFLFQIITSPHEIQFQPISLTTQPAAGPTIFPCSAKPINQARIACNALRPKPQQRRILRHQDSAIKNYAEWKILRQSQLTAGVATLCDRNPDVTRREQNGGKRFYP